MLFHHDPAHDDAQLDAIGQESAGRWQELGAIVRSADQENALSWSAC